MANKNAPGKDAGNQNKQAGQTSQQQGKTQQANQGPQQRDTSRPHDVKQSSKN